MAADPVAKELETLNRTLKEISSSLKEQTRILKMIALNYIEVHRKSGEELLPALGADQLPVDPSVEDKEPKKVYGWSMAASVQREGGLKIGDMMIEKDESRWIWVGDSWERIEAPSG